MYILTFNILKDQLPFFTEQIPETEIPTKDTASKFGPLKYNWWLFLTIMPLVLIELFLEEL